MAIETNTKIGLISKALLLLGEKPLQSLSDDRYGATVGAGLFDLLYENELQSNRWRFACTKVALSRLSDTPLNQWQYAYQLPPDLLLLHHVYPVTRYEVYGSRIYTDAMTVSIDYLFKPEISQVPAYFATLLTYALARDMRNPIEGSEDAFKVMQVKYNMQRDRALFADAQGRPSTTVQSSPFTDVR